MKNLILTLFFLASIHLLAQTDGISYQAVIIGPDNQELPGVDAEGNILPNATVSIRFTIMDANNGMEYQEIQTTNTDQYGRINLTIGSINPDEFTKINWDGTSKDLKVEIDFSGGGSSFVDMSREKLTFLPYGFHRDIKATGKLVVDDVTDLNSELTVGGPTRLNSTLDVNNNNATNLTGELNVEGTTDLNSTLDVDGVTDLNDGLNVNNNAPANFSGESTFGLKATFEGPTAFKEPSTFVAIDVDGPSQLNGKVNINANVDGEGGQNIISNYPLLVQGSKQGIAIKVNGGRSKDNNYISFWDEDSGKMWGRIEGQTLINANSSSGVIRQRAINGYNIARIIAEIAVKLADVGQATVKLSASATSSTVCAGLGACVTAPIPSLIVEAGTKTIIKIANWVLVGLDLAKAIAIEVTYEDTLSSSIGVTYSSGSGDYAEWLPKQNLSDVFTEGELVGVKNGLVTKNVWGAEKVMIVSTRPIVLGNMPLKNDEKNNVKIAFMGQVPVKVIGNVAPGDYILPSELSNGFGKAVNPKDMKTRDYKKVAGVAWSVISKASDGISFVNTAVGINTNDLSDVVYKQEEKLLTLREEYNQLTTLIEKSNKALADLLPGYKEATGFEGNYEEIEVLKNTQEKNQTIRKDHITRHNDEDVIFFDISREQIKASIEIARETYQETQSDVKQINKLFLGENLKSNQGDVKDVMQVSVEDHPFWKKIDSNPQYKEEIIQFIKTNMEKAIHTHKKHAHQFTDVKLKE